MPAAALEVSPGFACFGELAKTVAEACRHEPMLIDRLLVLRRREFHCLGAALLEEPGVKTAANLLALLGEAPQTLLARALGATGHEIVYELLDYLPDRLVHPRFYRQLARIAVAGLADRIIGHEAETVLDAIDYWGEVAGADAITIAVADAVFPDKDVVRSYAAAITQGMAIGLIKLQRSELLERLSLLRGRTEFLGFIYRLLVAVEAPAWPVHHPAFLQIRNASVLWKPPFKVRARRRLVGVVTGATVILQYIGSGENPAPSLPLVLLNLGNLPTRYEIFGATEVEAKAIHALMPDLCPEGRLSALAHLIGDVEDVAELNDFSTLQRFHGLNRK